MVKVKIYEKGMTYHSAITLEVANEKHRRELEEILIACGNPYMVEPVAEITFVVGGDKDDF